LSVVDVPVILPEVTDAQVEALRSRWGIAHGQTVIGMVGRLAAEKGVEYLIEALPLILQQYPQARVIFVGNYQNVLGEEAYARRLAPMIANLGEHWTFVGRVSDAELAAFFKLCDLTVLPSLNSTEGFGMVQIESIISGTPAVGTDLPGVRVPVRITGMGKIVPPGDAKALAVAMIEILDHKERFMANISELAQCFAPQTNAVNYEAIFRKVLMKR
jgi:glycosyltransferase involved in cell wall biosynthesis